MTTEPNGKPDASPVLVPSTLLAEGAQALDDGIPNPNAPGGFTVPIDSALDFSAVAKRVPFKFKSHMACENEHGLMHWNEPLNIACETITKYRDGEPGKSKRWFYVNERKSKMFRSLTELLNAHPLLGQLAEATYPSNAKAERREPTA